MPYFFNGIYLFSLQGGNHLLQMLWQGNPVTLSCPMSTQAFQSPMDPPLIHPSAPTTEAPCTTEATSSTASKLPPQDQQQQQLIRQQQLMQSYSMHPGYSNTDTKTSR